MIPFERNPLRTGILRSSNGYQYMVCARQFHYSAQTNLVQVTDKDQEAFDKGIAKHKEIQSTIYRDFQHEYRVTRTIPAINGVQFVSATLDCINENRIVEIKPKYSRMAYGQTLIERFVKPLLPIFLYAYLKEQEFPLKADYEMSLVYIGRMLTSLVNKPPRVPHANKEKFPCKTCPFQERCFSEDETTWEEFKEMTNPAIERLQSI